MNIANVYVILFTCEKKEQIMISYEKILFCLKRRLFEYRTTVDTNFRDSDTFVQIPIN